MIDGQADTYIFDGSRYPDLERMPAINGRSRRRRSDGFYEGLGILVLLSATTVWFWLSGDLNAEPIYLYAMIAVLVIVGIIVYSTYSSENTVGATPVRVTSEGIISAGRRRWNCSEVGDLVIIGSLGPVQFKDTSGRSLGYVDRAQFGDLKEFLVVVRKKNPLIIVSESGGPMKVRIPK